jgi:hypothetical protein
MMPELSEQHYRSVAGVTVQGHERGRMRLGQNDCLRGEKEIPKENSFLSYLHNIHKVRLFIKYESHMIVPSQQDQQVSYLGLSSSDIETRRENEEQEGHNTSTDQLET